MASKHGATDTAAALNVASVEATPAEVAIQNKDVVGVANVGLKVAGKP